MSFVVTWATFYASFETTRIVKQERLRYDYNITDQLNSKIPMSPDECSCYGLSKQKTVSTKADKKQNVTFRHRASSM